MNSALFAFLLCSLISFTVAAPTNLFVVFRAGKTFVTFKEDGDTTGKTYNIYRSAAAILSVHSKSPLVNIPGNSSFDPRFSAHPRFVITDNGTPLDSTTGLFVYTPHDTSDEYYAVTTVASGVEDTHVVVGSNALSAPVHEAWWPWPKGVIQGEQCGYSHCYLYFYWNDYFDWPKNYGYYGNYFTVTIHAADLPVTKPMPLAVSLHAYGGTPGVYTMPSMYPIQGVIILALCDPCVLNAPACCQSYWYGRSNHFLEHGPQAGDTIVDYNEMRIINYLQSVKSENTLYKVDSERIYVTGQSMGGGGTFTTAMHHPDIFAAARPWIGRIHYNANTYSEDFWRNEWGNRSLGLTARNGIPIYNWMDAGWIAKQHPGKDYPPILDWCGSQDGLHPFYTHRYLYLTFSKTRHAIFGRWANVDHTTGDTMNVMPGDMLRFKRNEMYPAFTNATTDDNWGKADSSLFDVAGVMNVQIDWTCALHKLGLSNDSLIDCADSLSITCQAMRPNTHVDITPRRLQHFAVLAGQDYKWKNVDVAGGSTIDFGTVTADVNKLITIPQFAIALTGSRLVIKPAGGTPVVDQQVPMRGNRLSALPNPFTASVRLHYDGIKASRLAVYDMAGRQVCDLTGKMVRGDVTWNASGRPAGVYMVKLVADGYPLKKKIVLVR